MKHYKIMRRPYRVAEKQIQKEELCEVFSKNNCLQKKLLIIGAVVLAVIIIVKLTIIICMLRRHNS